MAMIDQSMPKEDSIVIIYGSRRGKTRDMATIISQILTQQNIEHSLVNVYQMQPEDLLEHKYIILGCSTWNDGDLEVDFFPFEKDWRAKNLNLKGHLFAVFGPGDTRFRFFCEAVRILEARCRSCKAKPLLKSFMWDELEGEFEQKTQQWGEALAQELQTRLNK